MRQLALVIFLQIPFVLYANDCEKLFQKPQSSMELAAGLHEISQLVEAARADYESQAVIYSSLTEIFKLAEEVISHSYSGINGLKIVAGYLKLSYEFRSTPEELIKILQSFKTNIQPMRDHILPVSLAEKQELIDKELSDYPDVVKYFLRALPENPAATLSHDASFFQKMEHLWNKDSLVKLFLEEGFIDLGSHVAIKEEPMDALLILNFEELSDSGVKEEISLQFKEEQVEVWKGTRLEMRLKYSSFTEGTGIQINQLKTQELMQMVGQLQQYMKGMRKKQSVPRMVLVGLGLIFQQAFQLPFKLWEMQKVRSARTALRDRQSYDATDDEYAAYLKRRSFMGYLKRFYELRKVFSFLPIAANMLIWLNPQMPLEEQIINSVAFNGLYAGMIAFEYTLIWRSYMKREFEFNHGKFRLNSIEFPTIRR